MQPQQPSTSVRAKNGAKALDIGESTFWRLTQRPDFPKARKLSPRVTVWDLGELLAWRDAQANPKAPAQAWIGSKEGKPQ